MATVLAAGSVQAGGDAAAGQAKAALCAACHGADGNSVNPAWPKLAGQHPDYIVKQLQAFRSTKPAEKRSDPLMTAQAMLIASEQDIEDIAAYFSSQKPTGGVAASEMTRGDTTIYLKDGEKLYRAGNSDSGIAACMGCHGPKGVGNPGANFPRISGQHAAYVEKALKDFRDGNRKNDAQKMMQGVAANMTDEEIAAVAQYVQGLH
jgi:cytochrome c553